MTGPPANYIPTLGPSLAYALGEFIATWSGTEGLITVCLTELTVGRPLDAERDDIVPMAPFIGMEVRVKVGLLKTLVRARLGNHQGKAIDKIGDDLLAAKDRRDFYAHTMWDYDVEKKQLFAMTVKAIGKVRRTRARTVPEDIWHEITKLHSAANALIAFLQTHGYAKWLVPPQEKSV